MTLTSKSNKNCFCSVQIPNAAVPQGVILDADWLAIIVPSAVGRDCAPNATHGRSNASQSDVVLFTLPDDKHR